jgi:hypothetical protein
MYLSLITISALFCIANGFQMKPVGLVRTSLFCTPNNMVEKKIVDIVAEEIEIEPLNVQWLPIGNIKAPEMLDGTLAGDVGFDPLGFSKSKKTLYWMREAEVKHSRLAMLAAVGWPLSELLHKNLASILQMDSILALNDKAPSILNGGLSNTYATGTLIATSAIAAFLESKSMDAGNIFWNENKPEDYVPGDLGFDPYELYNKRDGDKKSMETAELKHGRLAMISVFGYVVQEFVTEQPLV